MKKSLKIINGIAMCLLLTLFVVLDCFAYRYKNHITMFLCGNGTDYSSEEYQEQKNESDKLATQIAEEGIVLLKNQNNTLPLQDTIDLNVFGWSGCDNGMIYMGFGSGTASTYNQISIYSALRDIGYNLNEELCELYNKQSFRRDTGWQASSFKMYEPNELLTERVMKNAKEFSSTALVVLSRFGMEAFDLPTHQRNEKGEKVNNNRSYLYITEKEEELLNKVTDNFEKVIVVINSANTMELGFLDNEKIDAALDIYFPGNNGSKALASILCGAVTPSGHTVDTFAYDHTTGASYANNGANVNTYTNFSKGYYVDYAENIYTGYYWYETAYYDGFWDSEYAKKKWNISGYKDVVQFPFGYGLSYTDFSWEVEEVNFKENDELSADSEIEYKVKVTNIGKEYSGQDVVELYYSAPYYKNGIEKPSIKLGAFAKTKILDPGSSETLTLKIKLEDMASYDCYDANNNGFMGYELEEGTYSLSLRTDVHNIKNIDKANLSFKVKDVDGKHTGFKYELDDKTGNKVTNLFTTYKNETSGAESKNIEKALSNKSYAYSIDGNDSNQNIKYLTRNDFVNSFPEAANQREMSNEFKEKTYDNSDSPIIYSEDKAPEFNSNKTKYTLDDMLITSKDENGKDKITGLVDYNDEKWDDLVSQLSINEVADLCGDGGLKTIEIKSINKPLCKDSDGPSGFNTTIFGSDKYGGYAASYPCEVMIASTWNWKMAYMMGYSVGGEGAAANIQGWYGPACNLHRTPIGGRNYEYYSEDPYLSGIMCSYTVLGAKEQGLYAYVKHFVVNETENVRSAGYTWLTEQTLRENYLLPFEKAVKTGGTLGIMSSYNRIGSTRTSGSYNLLTNVLRNEWGFKGCVISDYNNNIPVLCPDEAIRAGNDLLMEASGGAKMYQDKSSNTALKSLHNGAKNILYCYTASKYYKATSKGLDMNVLISKSNDVFAWWIPALYIVNAIVLLGTVDWFIRIYFPKLYQTKKKENE